jgi:hypothetical protein
MGRMSLRTAIVLLVQTVLADVAFAQQPTLTVSKNEAKCIADNVDMFLEEPGDPVTIYLDICLPADKLKGLVAGTVRADLPSIGSPKTGATSTKSVTLTKAELRCLKSAAGTPGFPATDPFPLVSNCP